jgi:hypothetical protein
MEPFSELQSLWAAATPPLPADPAEIVRLVKRSQRNMRWKMIGATLALLLSGCVQLWVLFWFEPKYATTRLGLLLTIGVSAWAMGDNMRQWLLLRTAEAADSMAISLEKMLRYQYRMQRYVRRRFTILFLLLAVGLLLYLYEFAHHSVMFTVLSYGSTILYMAFCWFWLKPRIIRKNEKSVGEIIQRLKRLQADLKEESS